jgi:glycopeptide antibiotics resistance protein
MINTGCYQLYGILISIAFLIVIYHLLWVQNNPKTDFLNKIVFDHYSFWPMTHLLLFMFLTIFFPNVKCIIHLMIIGIAWEVIETLISKLTKSPKHTININDEIQYSYNWWAGSLSDIFFNSLGILLGLIAIFLFHKHKNSIKP